MATSQYPDGIDVFNVPTEPEGTPLSSAGTATRNHTQLHDAVDVGLVAVQTYAAIKTHDHSGDGSDRKKGAKLSQVNTHENADTDLSATSKHHTLGKSATQAAFGNHTHDYRTSEITNKPFQKVTSTSRPQSPELGDVIWEADTNRMRVWAQFPGEQTANQGLYSVDDLERTSTANLGASLWQQTYVQFNDLTHGKMATPGGHSAAWIPQGSSAQRCIARRINSADAHTVTNDQVIIFNTNSAVNDYTNSNQDNPTTNDVYFRMSDDGQTYIRAALTWYKGSVGSLLLAYTTTGPTGEQLIGQLAAQSNTPNILWQMRLIGNKFECYMGVQYVGSIVDPIGVTLTGFKGWGFGMQAGPGTFGGQDLPNEISQIGIADATYYTTSAIWQLLPVGDVPKVGLVAGHAQAINPTGSVIEWDTAIEDNFGFYHSAQKTAITITEAGIYHVHASIIWGTNLLGDHAATVLLINDQKTPHMHWEFVRGYDYTPGFSQTVDVTAYVRLNVNDRLGVAAAHNGAASQYTGYKKGDQITQLSRLFVVFHSA